MVRLPAGGSRASARRRTSSSTMRPPGPVPSTNARSTPNSCASRRASGEARTDVSSWSGASRRPPANTSTPAGDRFSIFGFSFSFSAHQRTSASTIRPPGPLASTCARSIPNSAAFRRARGVAKRRVGRGVSVNTWLNIPPIGTLTPASTRIGPNTPSAGDSTSTLTLSVSISSTDSPLRTASPAAFSQRTTLPSVMVRPSWGM